MKKKKNKKKNKTINLWLINIKKIFLQLRLSSFGEHFNRIIVFDIIIIYVIIIISVIDYEKNFLEIHRLLLRKICGHVRLE